MHIPPSLKHKKFFYLWLGQLISITGTQKCWDFLFFGFWKSTEIYTPSNEICISFNTLKIIKSLC